MRLCSEFRDGYLWGRSFDSPSPKTLVAGAFDLSIVATSWDSRCLSLTAATEFRSTATCVLRFHVKDSAGMRDKHDPVLIDFCQGHSERVSVLDGPSVDLQTMWSRLREEIWRAYKSLRRPLRVFIDTSACPRFYSLAVLAASLAGGLAQQVSLFYAEGRYPEPDHEPEIAFTGERWKSVAVPGLEGACDPDKDRFFLVAVGFEGWKTLRAVAQADPDRVSVLFPSPGTQPGYDERTRSDNATLFQEYRIPDMQIVKAPAGDAVAAWAALSEAALERPDIENSYFLCCGTKAHSIALGLRAIVARYPAVLYNVPDEHKVVPIEASGRYWLFDIVDLTAPAAD